METARGGGGTWVIFLLDICSWLLRTSAVFQPMLWPVIDPIFVRFWARPEWFWSRLLNIEIR